MFLPKSPAHFSRRLVATLVGNLCSADWGRGMCGKGPTKSGEKLGKVLLSDVFSRNLRQLNLEQLTCRAWVGILWTNISHTVPCFEDIILSAGYGLRL